MAQVFVISGPSGVGKSSLIRGILAECSNIRLLISTTTRKPRAEEVDGQDYFFASKDKFIAEAQEGGFLEWVFRYGHYYGTPREQLISLLKKGHQVLLDIETTGAKQLRRLSEGAVFIFIRSSSTKELHQRLIARDTEQPESLHIRLKGITQEMRQMKDYQFVLKNKENLSHQALQELKQIITLETEKPTEFHFNQDTATIIWQRVSNDAKLHAIKAMQIQPLIQEFSTYQKHYCFQKVLELTQKQIDYILPATPTTAT